VEQFHLSGAIYIKPLAFHEPTIEKLRIFEQKQISRVLEEELKITLNLKKIIITYITTLELKEKVEIIS